MLSEFFVYVLCIGVDLFLLGSPNGASAQPPGDKPVSFISDVAPIIARSVETPAARNQLFNVGADVPYTVNNLARIVAESMGKECNVVHLDPRNEVKVAFSDHTRAEKVFGRREKVPLEVGIPAMARWVKENGSRESCIFEEIEIPKNMPPSWANVTLARSSAVAKIGA